MHLQGLCLVDLLRLGRRHNRVLSIGVGQANGSTAAPAIGTGSIEELLADASPVLLPLQSFRAVDVSIAAARHQDLHGRAVVR